MVEKKKGSKKADNNASSSSSDSDSDTDTSDSEVQKTTKNLFMSVALGKATIEGVNVIALSPQSPLGSKLMGNEVSFSFDMNGKPYTIESVS